MILYLHFMPEDKLKVTTKGPFVRFEVGEENFEVHCVAGQVAAFIEQLREQTDLLVREEARIAQQVACDQSDQRLRDALNLGQQACERVKNQAAPAGQGDVVA